MKNLHFRRFRLFLFILATSATWTLLLFSHFSGGIPSHHILADENLPKISNAWGAIIVPVLVWLTVTRVGVRENIMDKDISQIPKKVIVTFFTGIFLGLAIVLSFMLTISNISDAILLFLLVASLFLPIYNAEDLLGFVLGLGMTNTFGAVLPTGLGLILCFVGYLAYNLIRPMFIWLINFILKKVP